jgi:hypothetical protein
VGSGAGGGSRRGGACPGRRSVVVLEAGPFVPEPEMPVDELAAFDRLYLNHGFNVSWDAALMTLAGGAVGGGTTVNWMTCIAPPASSRRRWATEHGLVGFDEPALDADVAALEDELSVRLPPNVPPKDALIQRGCTELRQEVGLARRNGADCGDCGRCGFGCRARREAVRPAGPSRGGVAGRGRIVPDAPVRRVLVEAARRRRRGERGRTACRARSWSAPRGGGSGGRPADPRRAAAVRARAPATGRHLRLHPVGVIGALPTRTCRCGGHAAGGPCAPPPRGRQRAGRAGRVRRESAPGTPGLIALVFPWEGRSRSGS